MTSRHEIIQSLALAEAAYGASDAYDGKEPQSTGYWYWVGYLIHAEQLDPEEAMEKAKLHCNPNLLG